MVLLKVVLYKPDVMGDFIYHSPQATDATLNNLKIRVRQTKHHLASITKGKLVFDCELIQILREYINWYGYE